GVNDMILMAAYMDRETNGVTASQAVAMVNRHIPDYQMPSRVAFNNAFGRSISKALRDPSLFAFGRYEYNRLASYGHMVTDLLSKNSSFQDRARALDQLAMVAFASMFIYPFIMDPVAKAVTGNPNATANRAGPTTIPFWIDQYMHNDKELREVFTNQFPLAPATTTAIETINNRNLFNGEKQYTDIPEFIKSIADSAAPVQQILDMTSGKMTPGQELSNAFTIKSPTNKQINAHAAYKKKEQTRQKKDEERKKKRGY
ncbi:MAG: hypothetical protein ACREQ5_34460, partial [Candidatus Dormibacteria bacterium]